MVELAQLFQDLEAAVVQQEPLVMNVEEQAELVKEDVTKANVELGGAVTSARAARRKKWWCLGISSECCYRYTSCPLRKENLVVVRLMRLQSSSCLSLRSSLSSGTSRLITERDSLVDCFRWDRVG